MGARASKDGEVAQGDTSALSPSLPHPAVTSFALPGPEGRGGRMTEGVGEHDGEGVGGVNRVSAGGAADGRGGWKERAEETWAGAATWMRVVLGARGRWDDCRTAWAEVGHAGDSRGRRQAAATDSEREAKVGTMRGCGAAQRRRGRAPRISPPGFASASAADSGARCARRMGGERKRRARAGAGSAVGSAHGHGDAYRARAGMMAGGTLRAGRASETQDRLGEDDEGTVVGGGASGNGCGVEVNATRGADPVDTASPERRRECGWFAVYGGDGGLHDVVWETIKRWASARGLANGVLVSKVAKGSVAKLEPYQGGRRGTGSLCHIAGESKRACDEGDRELAETLVIVVEGQRRRCQLERKARTWTGADASKDLVERRARRRAVEHLVGRGGASQDVASALMATRAQNKRVASIQCVRQRVRVGWGAGLVGAGREVACKAIPVSGVTSSPEGIDGSTYDYIVIGGGLAGSRSRARLSEDPAVSVLVVEAGADDRDNPAVFDIYEFTVAEGTALDWQYPAEDGRIINSGRTLGGCSSINGGWWTRGSMAQYDLWSTLLEELEADVGWNWDGMLHYMRKSENFMPPTADQLAKGAESIPVVHGSSGPVHAAFSHGMYDLSTGNPNCVSMNPVVTKIVWVDTKLPLVATGIEFATYTNTTNGTTRFIAHSSSLLGLFVYTPAVLQLSGVGDADILGPLNITTLIDLKTVGRNLQEQYFSLLGIILASASTPFRINGKFAKQPSSVVTATGILISLPSSRESSPEPDQHISPILPFPFSDMSDDELNTPPPKTAEDILKELMAALPALVAQAVAAASPTPVTPQANNLAAPPVVPFIQAPPLFAQPPPLRRSRRIPQPVRTLPFSMSFRISRRQLLRW
ncbi:hypothetical protein B0H14DRAFT_2575689 [Mycena olivaceomarginata]|nr:hypothetical protein B0H14DRAFT_2575689 [Mycena olivaceomarginata]